MSVILNSGSSVSLTTGVETTLTQIGTPGRFQLVADLSNLANGDAIEFKVKIMASAGGTARVAEDMIFYGQQFSNDIVKFSSVHNNDQSDAQSLVFTANQIVGSSKTLIWKVLQIDPTPSNFLNMTIDAQGRVAVGQATISGSLPSPQRFDLIGNITGSIQGNITTVITGAAANIDYSQVWSYTGSKVVDAVKGGFVTVSGTVIADVRSLVGISGTVVASAVQGGTVTVSGTVVASAVQGGFVTVSGTVVADVRSLVGVSGTVIASAVQGGVVTVSGTVNLASPQVVNFIGNISGTVTNNYLREQEIELMIGLLKEDERAIVGSMFYVDGTRGNDVSGDGTRLNPFKTITRALIQVTAHAHDAIFLLPIPTGTNTITETGTVTINKADVQIYGPGYDVLVTNIPATNRDVFNITAEGVGLHQFRLTASGNSSNGVTFSGGAALGLLSHLWIESVTQDGVFINVGNRNRIEHSYIQTVGRDGVRINSGAGSGTYNRITDTTIRNNVGNGINLLGVDASNTIISKNIVRDNIGFGVAISAGTSATQITDNRIFNNTAGPISDAGTNTLQQWNFFNTDTVGIPLAVYNLVSGSIVADRVWQYTGTRIVDYVRGLVGVSGTVVASAVQGGQVTVSGTVVASAVQGGFVTVSGAVVADVRSLVGVSGTVLASAVQSLVGVSGTVVASAVQGGFVTVSGTVTAGNVTGSVLGDVNGTVGAVRGGLVTVSGAVTLQPNQVVIASAVQGGFVTVSGTVIADVRSLVGVSGTVIVGQNNDKTGYSLSSPQRFDLIGNITGSMQGSVVYVITGAAANIDYSQVWSYTGSKVVDAVKGGYVFASGTTVNIDYSQIWSFTGSKVVDAVKGGYVTVSGTVMAQAVQGGFVTVSGTVIADVRSLVGISGTVIVGQNLDKSGYGLSDPQHFNLIGNISGTITNVYNVISGTSVDAASIWQYTGTKIVDAVKGGFVTASGVTANVDPSTIWNYTGTKVVDAVRGGFMSVSGTVIVSSGTVNTVFNVVSGTAATIDYGAIWSYTGSRSLNGTQNWNLNGNISGTIQPPITAVATGVVIDYASIWGYATRTLTDQVFNLPPVEQGNNLNIRRGDTFSWSPTNLGSLANLSKLYFTVKRLYTDLDSESEAMVEKTAGLLYINRQSAANPLHGSIVVLDAALGNITITIDASETAKLDLLTDVYYDVQFINTSGTVTTLVAGLVTIDGDATRGTS